MDNLSDEDLNNFENLFCECQNYEYLIYKYPSLIKFFFRQLITIGENIKQSDINFFLNNGINLNDNFGYEYETVLSWACEHRCYELMKLLLENGIKISQYDVDYVICGHSLYDQNPDIKIKNCLEILLKYNCDETIHEVARETIEIIKKDYQNDDVVSFLIEFEKRCNV